MTRTVLLTWLLVLAAAAAEVACAQPVPAGQPSEPVWEPISPSLPAATPVANSDQENNKPASPAPTVASANANNDSAVPLGIAPLKPLDLQPTLQIRGRIEAEAVMAAQSQASKEILGDLQNGYGFRRVRLGAQGNIGDSTSWVSEVELAGGNIRLRDVFVGLDAIPGVRQIRVGYFREPYSLEGMTSSNFITFLERSPVNVLSPARNWGVCAYWWPDNERLLFSTGAFRVGTGSNGQSLGDDDNWAVTTRLTGLPIYEPDGDVFRLLHVGGAFSQRIPPDGVVAFTPRTQSNLLTVEDNPGSPFLSFVEIPGSSFQLYNLQAAYVVGRWSVQSEWMGAAVQQTGGGVVFFNGVYLYGSCFLTGEHRGYNRTRGSFDQVDVLRPLIRDRGDPRGGFGAVELAARIAYLNFDSPNLPPAADGTPQGDRLYEFTAGINWYLNSYTRVMFNYTAGFPDKAGIGSTVAHIFGLRTAIYW